MPEPISIATAKSLPPDDAARRQALDPSRSFLVQAPAGSGKTYLLTQRFLRLLAQAERPDEIVAITFTKAAAAEMNNRILDALEKAEANANKPHDPEADPDSLEQLALAALEQSKSLGWQLLDQPGQLRITTIDAFCRGLALQSPLSWGLLSGLGGQLDTTEKPKELYKHAAERTLERLSALNASERKSIEELLLWRDNNWKDLEGQIVDMLAQRNRWYQEFVFSRNNDHKALRQRLEAPFRRDLRRRLDTLCRMMDAIEGCSDGALQMARAACEIAGKSSPMSLAERAELPSLFTEEDEALLLQDAADAYRDLANFLLTKGGTWRNRLTVNEGFHPSNPALKTEMIAFLDVLRQYPSLEAVLASFQSPSPSGYTEEEWTLIFHCFAVLRIAAAELQVVFAESGVVDFTEVSQIALRILAPENGAPSEFAFRQADSIRHLLIDEFQDTSRNQHQLLARLIAAWPDTEGRSCFCVGDPMQSIYGFREAEVELFGRLRTHGLEIDSGPDIAPFRFEFLQLEANFRTVPSLVEDLNTHFERIFPDPETSGEDATGSISFAKARPMRLHIYPVKTELHLGFTQAASSGTPNNHSDFADSEITRANQLSEMVALIQDKLQTMSAIQAEQRSTGTNGKYRIAVLGRTRPILARIAEALREAKISFRAIDLVKLRERPEVLDALALARALLNPVDRTAWLGVLRAPWCGLSLGELHLITSADDSEILATPVPSLLASRVPALYGEGRLSARAFKTASRVSQVLRRAVEGRPEAANTALGTWLESVWKALGGDDTVDDEQRQNLRRLWAVLDELPGGETSLLGASLDTALDELYALPDPAASSDFGVQLMTIHKSKGLEFEVVIVPDLDERGRQGERTMISWLERGLPGTDVNGSDDESPLTEFLIAPFQAKGAEAGAAKQWVDAVKRKREKQELRRLLYVAATRARDELHLFARPRFGVNKTGIELKKPCGLLETAWPALGGIIEAEFADWLQETENARLSAETETVQIAAEAGNIIIMPSPLPPTPIRRLPEDYIAPEFQRRKTSAETNPRGEIVYARTEGGLRSRLEGIAIHKLMERLAGLHKTMNESDAEQALVNDLPAIIAEIRSYGLPMQAAQKLVREALAVVQQTLRHPTGAWVLTAHPHAEVELRWSGLVGEAAPEREAQLSNLRPDRVFLAPAPPNATALAESGTGGSVWWVIDYKTSHAPANFSSEAEELNFKLAHREQHIDQLRAYVQLLRGLLENATEVQVTQIRAGIYYPRLQLFDDWPA